MTLSRRQFLRGLGGVTAAATLPLHLLGGRALAASEAQALAELTTLAQTLRPGPPGELGYRGIVTGPGEPHLVREELAAAAGDRAATRRSLLCFVHLTDQHIIDVQSPSRVEFLDRYADNECSSIPFSSAHRPQEAANARITDAMLRRLRQVGGSPITGAPFAAMISTGDNTDNQQANELDVFMALMDGEQVRPNSGNPDVYEGVQASGDLTYWHPDPSVNDFYKQRHGFPSRAGWLEEALSAFQAVGAGVPWLTCYGNHDGLAQGNAPVNPAFERIGVGGVKVTGLPPGANPCEHFGGVGSTAGAPGFATTPDPQRRYLSRQEWIERHFQTTGAPVGHGFTQANVDANVAYYATDVGPLRFIVLDTVNPGGLDSGSVGEAQLQWLSAQLAAAQDAGRLVIVFSHHGLRSMDNPNEAPDPLNPQHSDLPRHRADDVLAVVSQYRCVIAWVNGHTHSNVIAPHDTFWDIGTAAHIDWPLQSRILDVIDNGDGTLSIFTTMVDHEDDRIASFARELALNDFQKSASEGEGKPEDRNTELLLPHPFAAAGGDGGPTAEAGAFEGAPTLPATGATSAVRAAGAFAVIAGASLLRVRDGHRGA